MKKGQGNKELWLLPPIMGFGFIFNSLNLPAINAFAFNYPMAMGIEGKHSISEIANALIQERISFGNMPEEVTLLGYSMGGLMAFEMAKWLESNNVKVKELIVFDKTAQPEAGRKIKRIVLTNELIDIARQISSDDKDYDRIINYLKIHEQMIEDYQQSGCLNCEITIHYCNDGFEIDDFLKWQRFSNKKINLNKITNCSHYGIPKIWNNLELNI